jgi:hypothetical protein
MPHHLRITKIANNKTSVVRWLLLLAVLALAALLSPEALRVEQAAGGDLDGYFFRPPAYAAVSRAGV